MIFSCDRCGLCCQSVGMSEAYRDLDRGDGVCRYYDDKSHLCNIYETRPLRCNIGAYYDAFLRDSVPRDIYDQMNAAACQKLKEDNFAEVFQQGPAQAPSEKD